MDGFFNNHHNNADRANPFLGKICAQGSLVRFYTIATAMNFGVNLQVPINSISINAMQCN
jgi:hypothetical protein